MTKLNEVGLIDTLHDLSVYFNISTNEVLKRMEGSELRMADLWRAHDGDADHDAWYARADVQAEYIFTLSEFWNRDHRKGVLDWYVDQLGTIDLGAQVLDWGAGTGEIIINAAYKYPELHFTYADFPGPKREFVMWRAFRHELSNMSFTDLRPLPKNYRVSAVVCTSTLEHDANIEATTKMLCGLLKNGGIGLFEVDWIYNRDFPMHLTETYPWAKKWGEELMPSLGMNYSNGVWTKVGHV